MVITFNLKILYQIHGQLVELEMSRMQSSDWRVINKDLRYSFKCCSHYFRAFMLSLKNFFLVLQYKECPVNSIENKNSDRAKDEMSHSLFGRYFDPWRSEKLTESAWLPIIA